MDNATIAEEIALLSKLMDIHGDNSYKARSYAHAAFQIEKLHTSLSSMAEEDIFRIKGIGEAIGKKILIRLETGRLALLEKYLEQTPPGVLEMIQIKGLGPRKIAVIWKELGVENLGELLYACNENRLMLYKGFGVKTQEGIRQSIEFYMASKGQFLYKEMEDYAAQFINYWTAVLDEKAQIALTGDIRRQCNILDQIALVINRPVEYVKSKLPPDYNVIDTGTDNLKVKSPENIRSEIFCCPPECFALTLFRTTGSKVFMKAYMERYPDMQDKNHTAEEDIFHEAGLPVIPPSIREDPNIIDEAQKGELPDLITRNDIKGIIHAHSTWSDGKNTLEEMAAAARDQGFEYLVISDHSQSATYANGLKQDRILAQHQQIEELNERLFPFRIFKSIESDILSDGSLDYSDNLLRTFDLVIASIHSNLKMDEQKAMQRLLNAITNPFTTILGHLTGRLLLSRRGYPVDHKTIIDACAAHGVAIEINAHPRRLDMDWQWIPYAMKQGVILSIDPDAHAINGINDVKYGVLSAQKGGLSADVNLSSFPLKVFESFLQKKKLKHSI